VARVHHGPSGVIIVIGRCSRALSEEHHSSRKLDRFGEDRIITCMGAGDARQHE
jgi:hypothetical protein